MAFQDVRIIPMVNNTNDGLRNVGMDWVYQELRDPLEGDCLPYGVAHPSGKPYPYGPDGWRVPGGMQDPRGPAALLESEVRYLWMPRIVSVSAAVNAPDGNVSTVITNEILADFVAYDVFQGAKDPSGANHATLRTTTQKQPIAGFRTGQPGGRLVYATNAGHGYRVPLQANTNRNNQCAPKAFRVFALSLTWDLADDGTAGDWIIHTEWTLEQL